MKNRAKVASTPCRRIGCLIGLFLIGFVGCSQSIETDQTKTAETAFDSRPPSGTFTPPKPSASAPTTPATTTKSPTTAKQNARQPSPAARQRALADLANAVQEIEASVEKPKMPDIDVAAVEALGIRKLSGQYLDLYTDLRSQAEIDSLPKLFDAAVPKWCEYFGISIDAVKDWRIAGYLMQEKSRFDRGGLIPGDLPEFLHGYARGAEIWLLEQPSDYYRRHLLLHEGTHAFMSSALSGTGPPWYMEGTAELMATHRWEDGQLTCRYFPKSRDEVLQWGRIKIIQDDFKAGKALRLGDVLEYDSTAHLRVEPYGWCWALSAFLDGHPEYQERFRNLRTYARDRSDSFSQRFLGWFAEDRELLWREWQWFIVNIDYGYDVEREAVKRHVGESTSGNGTYQVAADRGWQSTGMRIDVGKTYRLKAEGRFQLAQNPNIWWSEPNGVTVRYHRGLPLGTLLAAVVDTEDAKNTENGFLTPTAIGSANELQSAQGGILYLRVNDSPAELRDNQGHVTVQVTAAE